MTRQYARYCQEELYNERHCKPADEPGFSERSSLRSGQDEFSIGFSAPSFTWNLIACAARVVIIFDVVDITW